MKDKPQDCEERLAKAAAVRKAWRKDAEQDPCVWILGVTAGIEIIWSIMTRRDPRFVIVETPVSQAYKKRTKGWFNTAI